MPTLEDLHRMSQINAVDGEELADINDISIDPLLPAARRMENYLSAVKNPYHFRCGASVVHLKFDEEGPDLKSCLVNYLQSLKRFDSGRE